MSPSFFKKNKSLWAEQTVDGFQKQLIEATPPSKKLLASFDETIEYFTPLRHYVRPLEIAGAMHAYFEDEKNTEVVDAAQRFFYKTRFTKIYTQDKEPSVSKSGGVVIAATPRAGNTVLSRLLGKTTGYGPWPLYAFDDANYSNIDVPLIYQVHAFPKEANEYIEALDLEVSTITRHPLDVLVSAFRFYQYEDKTSYWLDGRIIPDPQWLRGKNPTSDQFIKWATSEGASNMLGISAAWWNVPGVKRIKYEHLMAHPYDSVGQLIRDMKLPAAGYSKEAVEKVVGKTFKTDENKHFWKGQSDNWKRFLPGDYVAEIYKVHKSVFQTLDYDKPESALSFEEALKNWEKEK